MTALQTAFHFARLTYFATKHLATVSTDQDNFAFLRTRHVDPSLSALATSTRALMRAVQNRSAGFLAKLKQTVAVTWQFFI